jgi:adenylate kinase family enzyme
MVRDRPHQPDAQQGWLLDGYPRTLAQVAELDASRLSMATASTRWLR